MGNMNFAEQVKVEQRRNPEVTGVPVPRQQTPRAQSPLL